MKLFKIDASSVRHKSDTLKFRCIKIESEDDLAREIFWPVAEKHGIIDQCLDLAHPVDIINAINEPSPARALDILLESASSAYYGSEEEME